MRNHIEAEVLANRDEVRNSKTFKAKTLTPTQRSNSQRGVRSHQSFNEDNSNLEQQTRPISKGQRNSEQKKRVEISLNNVSRPQTGIRNSSRPKQEIEDELSSLSGFSVSDNEENEDFHTSLAPKGKRYRLHDSDDENLDEENRDIVLNSTEDIKAQFQRHDIIRRKNETEKRQKEVLAARNINTLDSMPLKRPHTSHGPSKGLENTFGKYSVPHHAQKENVYNGRPQTANPAMREQAENKKPITFKAVYTKPYSQTLIEKKAYNYTDKNFKTLPKKSDPVSRFNAFQSGWNKSKFLKNNPKMKEGRKLNLAGRNTTNRIDFVPYKNQPNVFE